MGLGQTPSDLLERLFRLPFVKIEFDYNFCQYRGRIPHKVLGNAECSCPFGISGHPKLAEIYGRIQSNALHNFFMSERQRSLFSVHLPFLDFSKTSVLSSCFTSEHLAMFKRLRESRVSNGRYAVIAGSGGWHSEAKGTTKSVEYCQVNDLQFDIIPTMEYDLLINTISGYAGLVSLPQIDDTCPRVAIEAKLLGLDIITNINSQHVTEWWWKLDAEGIEQYLKSRPKFFWDVIDYVRNHSSDPQRG